MPTAASLPPLTTSSGYAVVRYPWSRRSRALVRGGTVKGAGVRGKAAGTAAPLARRTRSSRSGRSSIGGTERGTSIQRLGASKPSRELPGGPTTGAFHSASSSSVVSQPHG